jgi:phosphoglycolate phosphatase-like HAD superfamily hydrolase
MKQKWCIDFDDILADLGTGLIESMYEQTGKRHTPEEIDSWGFWWNHEHSDFIWGEQCFLSELWTQALQPVDGACYFLQALVAKGHDRFICTNRLKTQKPWVESWIENTFNYGYNKLYKAQG